MFIYQDERINTLYDMEELLSVRNFPTLPTKENVSEVACASYASFMFVYFRK